MEYLPLGKAFYKYSESEYKKAYDNRFNASETIHLDLSIHDDPAFLCQNAEILLLCLQINKVDKKIQKLRVAKHGLPGIALQQFSRRCLIDEVVLTNDIEGVTSTRREIGDILEKVNESRGEKRFYGLVKRYLLLQSQENIPLNTCEDIRNLYNTLVLPEVEKDHPENVPDGKIFRKDSVSVNSPSQREIHRGIVPEEKIIEYMEKALRFLHNQEYELLIRVSVFHYLIGYIHPFYDGNGRLSRFISSYMLSQELDPLVGYRLSYTIKENLKKYYESFKICNDFRNRGDITPFVISFLEIVKELMEKLDMALSGRYAELEHLERVLTRDPFGKDPKYKTLLYLLLQASLFSDEGISTRELLEIMEISRTTLGERMRKLAPYGYIVCTKNGSAQKYYKLNLEKLKSVNQSTDNDTGTAEEKETK